MEKTIEHSKNNLDCQILNLIENSIKNRKENSVSFSKNLREKLLEIATKEEIFTRINERLKTKNLTFLRHFMAEHNKRKDINPTDSDLTENGIKQAKTYIETYNSSPLKHDLIFISPLRRTISSLYYIYEVFKEKNIECIVTDLLREKLSSKMTNVGKPLPELKNYCIKTGINFNFEFINKYNWWIDDDWEEYNTKNIVDLNKKHNIETEEGFLDRIHISILWAIFRIEKNILFISHSKVYKRIIKNSKCQNGIEKQFDLGIIEEIIINFLQLN